MKKLIYSIYKIGAILLLVSLVLTTTNVNVYAMEMVEWGDTILIETSNDTVGGKYKTYQGAYTYHVYEAPDGKVEVAYLDGDTVVYKVYENNVLQDTVYYDDSYFNVQEMALTVEEKTAIESIIKNNEYTCASELEELFELNGFDVSVEQVGDAYIVDPFASAVLPCSVTSSSVEIGLNELIAAFPEYNKRLVASQSFLSAASNNSAEKTRVMYCRDTRNTYVIQGKTTTTLSAGLSVVAAAAKVFLSPATLRSYLGLANSVVNLIETVVVTRANKATADANRQACIYNDTYFNREVSVYSLWGTDTFQIGTSSDYSNAGWFAVDGTIFGNYDTSFVIQEGISAWNYNMNTYGYWRWGDL